MLELISHGLLRAFIYTNQRAAANRHYAWGGRAWTGR